MRYAVGAVLGALVGAVAAWLFALAADMLAERALLVIELSAVAGLALGVLVARRRARESS